MATVKELEQEIKVLRDLLETQYRETDKARRESEKADDEVLELKTERARLRLLGAQRECDLVFAWKRKYDALLAKQKHK